MGLQNVLHDRESQSRAAELSCAGLIQSKESFKDPLSRIRRDSGTVVDHPHLNGCVVDPTGTDPGQPARRTVFDRVVQEVDQDLTQSVDVRLHGKIRCEFNLQAHAFRIRFGADFFANLFEERPEFNRTEMHRGTTRFQLGDCEQVVDQKLQPIRMFENDFEKPQGRLRILPGTVEQRLHAALDEREWSSEFMTHVGNEVTAGVL